MGPSRIHAAIAVAQGSRVKGPMPLPCGVTKTAEACMRYHLQESRWRKKKPRDRKEIKKRKKKKTKHRDHDFPKCKHHSVPFAIEKKITLNI